MACGLVEVARKVARGAKLKVAVVALELGLGIRRVLRLRDHPARLF